MSERDDEKEGKEQDKENGAGKYTLVRIEFKTTPEKKAFFESEAKKRGIPLTTWVLQQCEGSKDKRYGGIKSTQGMTKIICKEKTAVCNLGCGQSIPQGMDVYWAAGEGYLCTKCKATRDIEGMNSKIIKLNMEITRLKMERSEVITTTHSFYKQFFKFQGLLKLPDYVELNKRTQAKHEELINTSSSLLREKWPSLDEKNAVQYMMEQADLFMKARVSLIYDIQRISAQPFSVAKIENEMNETEKYLPVDVLAPKSDNLRLEDKTPKTQDAEENSENNA